MANNHAGTITFQHGLLRITTTEVWSAEETVASGDIVRYWYSDARENNSSCTTQYTIEIDLSRPLETLLNEVNHHTRSQIKRAMREGFVVHVWRTPDDQVLRSFIEFYNQFAGQKISPSSIARLRALQQNEMLALSQVVNSQEAALVWHCYERTGGRVRCWYSVSNYHSSENKADRNEAGRANRYLHFKDMEAFQSAGVKIYDFGGWYSGKTDAKLLGINRFKEDFGGRIVKRSYRDVGMTPPGKCWLMLSRLKSRFSR